MQEQYLVEEIFEREFDYAEKYEQEKCNADDECITFHDSIPRDRNNSYGAADFN